MNLKRLLVGIILTGSLVLLTGCPMSPIAPEHKATIAPAPTVDDSVVTVPLHLDLSAFKGVVNASVPAGQDGDGAWGDAGGGWWVKFSWHRDAIGISANGQTIVASTTVHYHGQVSFSNAHLSLASCGVGEQEPTLTISLVATLTPEPDWSIKPTVSVPPAQVGYHCRLGAINYDISDRVAQTVHDHFAAQIASMTNNLAAKLRFNNVVEGAWNQVQQPFVLGAGSYFELNPQAARLGPLTSDPDGNGVTVVAGITARPVLQVGVPPSVTNAPLPALGVGPIAMGVHIEVPVQVSYDSLTDAINKTMAGHMYTFEGHRETIDSVAVYGSEQSAVVQVNLSGAASGHVYLTGVPRFDTITQNLYLDNLNYTVATNSIIAKVASWLLHQHFETILQAEAHVDLSAKVSTLRTNALSAINRPLSPHADLTGSIADIKPLGFVLSDGYITAYLVADGRAAIGLH